jgi:predicted small lipoprotein YifL
MWHAVVMVVVLCTITGCGRYGLPPNRNAQQQEIQRMWKDLADYVDAYCAQTPKPEDCK